MKVLFVTNAYPSPERPWLGTAVRLQEQGLVSLGINVTILYLNRTDKGKLVYLSAFSSIKKKFKEGSFDILHVQFGGIQALLGALAARKRCIITYHGTDLHGGSPPSLKEKISYSIGIFCSKLAIRMAGASIAVSRNLVEDLPRKMARRIEIIPTGVDYRLFRPMNKRFARKSLNLEQDLYFVLFCDNNNDPVKRRDIADKAVEILREQGLNANLLVMAHIPFEEIPIFINAADVLLVTSDKEGSPNIVKEALACNLPIVSVDVGDVAEMTAGVKNCRIVAREPKIIANALAEIVLTGERSDGREKRQNIIDNEKVCERVLEVYKRVLNQCSE